MFDAFTATIVLFILIVGTAFNLGEALGSKSGEKRGQIQVFTGEVVCSKLQDNSIVCVKPMKELTDK